MLVSPLPLFLDTYCLSTSSLGLNASYLFDGFSLQDVQVFLYSELYYYYYCYYYYYYYYSFESFSHECYPMVFHWSLSNSKSPQISRNLFCIPVDLNSAVVLTVSTRPIISQSPSPCTNTLLTVWSETITIALTVSFIQYNFFFWFLAWSWYLYLFLLSFSFSMFSVKTRKSNIWQVNFFFTISRFDRLAEIRWSVCISKLTFLCFFQLVFELSYQCIDVISNPGVSSSSNFSWHIQPFYDISWVFLFCVPFFEVFSTSSLSMIPCILLEWDPRCLSLW